MAEIRCPMCGKPNPDHLDMCEFCQARLKPLIISDAADETPATPDQPESESDLPGWLDFGSGDFSEEADERPFEDDSEDWLTRLGSDSESEEPSQLFHEPESEAENRQTTARTDSDNDNLLDWLKDPDKDRSAPSSEGVESSWLFGDETGAAADELPDWLTLVDEPRTASEAASEPKSGIPDWEKDVGQADMDVASLDSRVLGSSSDFAEGEDAGLPDWLTEEGETAEPVAPARDEDQSDWLSQFGRQDTLPMQDTAAFAEGDLPDWLSGEEEAESLEPAAEGVLPAWLTETEEPAGLEEEPATFAAKEGDLPDWLAGEEEAESLEPAAEGVLPAWLTETEDPAGLEEEPDTFAAEEGDLPDWLADAAAKSERPTIEGDLSRWLVDTAGLPHIDGSVPAFEAADDELLGWLSGDIEPESIEPASPGELPAWLSDLEEPAAVEGPAPSFAAAESDLPDWLAGEQTESVEPLEESGLPDWLADVSGVAAAAAAAKAVGDEQLPAWLMDSEDELGDQESVAEEGELPDWLASMEGFSFPSEQEPEILAPGSGEVSESRAIPEWLQGMQSSELADKEQFEPGSEPGLAVPFVSDDEFEDDLFALDQLSAWGADDPFAGSGQVTTQPDEADLAPAELPGWLAAMRPVESSPEDVKISGPAETSGPLAGLYSILAAEPDVIRLKKPPVYSNKLQVSEAQQAHAVLLQELLEVENKPRALPTLPMISGHRVFKAVLGAILVLIAFLTVMAGTEMTAMPGAEAIPMGVRQTSQLINALTPADTVLLAFDYEPGLAGEMDATSAAVVDHIMLRGAKLVLISTLPTGPVLAEYFIDTVQATHQYESGTQYVNLGYIPGGASGLASFARNPQWVVPNTLDGVLAWETEPLQNITQLSDFALVVFITDNPNDAQAWIEQVEPQLGDTPLVAVVSAQVEPMVRPYYDVQQAQLSGLVSGLTGGAYYEVTSRSNLARTYWDAFNIVLIVAVSAILIGAAITMISDLLARRKESGGESA